MQGPGGAVRAHVHWGVVGWIRGDRDDFAAGVGVDLLGFEEVGGFLEEEFGCDYGALFEMAWGEEGEVLWVLSVSDLGDGAAVRARGRQIGLVAGDESLPSRLLVLAPMGAEAEDWDGGSAPQVSDLSDVATLPVQ